MLKNIFFRSKIYNKFLENQINNNYKDYFFSKLIKIKRSKRRKSISIKIEDRKILVNAPFFVNDIYIKDLLIKKKTG